jgi:hypothetical protein
MRMMSDAGIVGGGEKADETNTTEIVCTARPPFL